MALGKAWEIAATRYQCRRKDRLAPRDIIASGDREGGLVSEHQVLKPREEALSLSELQAILARYQADNDSWPCGLANLKLAIRAKAGAPT